MNRKGQIADMMTFFIYIVYLSFFMLAIYIAWSGFNDGIQDSDLPASSKTFFDTQTNVFFNGSDNIFLGVFVAIVIGIIILTYFVSSTPILFWPMWLIVMILSAAAGYWANAYVEVTSEGELAIAAAQMPGMTYVMGHYLHFMVGIGLLMLLIFFAKPTNSGGQTL